MRFVSMLALCVALASADTPGQPEVRAWKGVVTVVARGTMDRGGKGHERQEERIEFLLLGKPGSRPKDPLTFKMRESKGGYTLEVELTEGEGARAVTRKGRSMGALYPVIVGDLDPSTGRFGFRVQATPARLTAHATLSGMHEGRFTTFRTPLTRAAFLRDRVFRGTLPKGGRTIHVHESLRDEKGGRVARDVEIDFRLERIEPVLRGVVKDHNGQPLPRVTIRARTSKGAGGRRNFLRTGETGPDGMFRIPAAWGLWAIEVVPVQRGPHVYAPRPIGVVELVFDDAPEIVVVADAYWLRALGDFGKLRSHFTGDVKAYLDWTIPRMDPRRVEAARVRPAK
ncbi:MAG: hypothetical protein ACYTGN_02030 [Planctomycetota bacterium]|jgi:hypothetical protein